MIKNSYLFLALSVTILVITTFFPIPIFILIAILFNSLGLYFGVSNLIKNESNSVLYNMAPIVLNACLLLFFVFFLGFVIFYAVATLYFNVA